MRGLGMLGPLVAVVAVAGCASATATRTPTTSLAGAPCGAETTQELAAVDGMAAERIYQDELHGPSTMADRHQVEHYAPLLRALSEDNRAAIHTAVKSLVYSGTHIVRLRVSQNGTLLDDEGGPYIIAPVGGGLSYHGRSVGSYLLSVQDDRGFVGLETRLIRPPVVLKVHGARLPVWGTIDTGSLQIPARGAVVLHNHVFQAYSFTAKAYPTGSLRISLFRPGRSSRQSCTQVKVAETTRIVHLIWGRLKADNTAIGEFAGFAESHTGALTFVRQGTTQLAGSSSPGPTAPPSEGTVVYEGRSYGVDSFTGTYNSAPVVVYTLVPLG